MRIILDADQTDQALTHITQLINTVRHEHTQLRTRFLTDRDGYPTRSMGGGTSPTNELDDDGTPIPQHNDPVGRLVISRMDTDDDLGTSLARMVEHIRNAMRELEAAISDAARARPPIDHPDPDTIWCESHLRYDMHEPRLDGNRNCRWCKTELADHGRLPSRRLIDAHDRGIRITDKLRREIATRDATERAARRTKRRGKAA